MVGDLVMVVGDGGRNVSLHHHSTQFGSGCSITLPQLRFGFITHSDTVDHGPPKFAATHNSFYKIGVSQWGQNMPQHG